MQRTSRSLAPVIVTVFIDMLGYGIVIPVMAPLFLAPGSVPVLNGLSTAMRTAILGALISSYPLAQFFGAPILGALSDRYGRKRVLMLALAGTSFDYLCFAYGITVGSLGLIFAGRIIAGFCGGNVSVVNSAIADVSDEKTKTRNFGLIGMAFGLGFIVGPYLGGKLSDAGIMPWFDYATPFWFAAGLTLLNVLFVAARFRETLTTRIQTPVSLFTGIRNLRRAAAIGNLRALFLVILLLTFGFNFFVLFFPVFLVQKFGFTQSMIGDMFAYAGLWIAVLQGTVIGPLARRYRPARLLAWSMLGLGLTLPLLVVVHASPVLYLLFPFISFFQGLSMPSITSLISDQAARDSQGEIMGILQSFQSVGAAFPPLISGLIVTIHAGLPILIASLYTLTAWAIFVLSYRHRHPQPFHEI